MEPGEVKDIHLMPEEAYGQPNPDAIFELEIERLPGSEDLTVGQQVYLTNQMGQPFPVKVTDKTEKTITFDANHEMAGKELNFKDRTGRSEVIKNKNFNFWTEVNIESSSVYFTRISTYYP